MSLMLVATKREKKSKGYLNQLRQKKIIPGVCYGSSETTSLEISLLNFKKIYQSVQQHILFDLDIEGDKKRRVLIKDYQIHPISKEVIHVDFIEVGDDKPIEAKIPIYLKGIAKGSRVGGVLEHRLKQLRIKVFPKDLPDSFNVTVEHLEVGDSVYVKDLAVNASIIVVDSLATLVATISQSRTTKLAEAAKRREEEIANKKVKK